LGDEIHNHKTDGACGTYRRGDKCIQNLNGKPVGKRPLARQYRWKDNIKMDLRTGFTWLRL